MQKTFDKLEDWSYGSLVLNKLSDSDLSNILVALGKQVAKEPQKQKYELLLEEGWEYACPRCKGVVGVNKKDTLGLTQHETYCPECGQKLNWD
jgi:hypothetical protein